MSNGLETQLTSTVVMAEPSQFGFNAETAGTNAFQHEPTKSEREIRDAAQREFDATVAVLRAQGVTVLILPSRDDVLTPDAVFPNNWFSHHQGGRIVLYPMLVPSRRAERQPRQLLALLQASGFECSDLIDLTSWEDQGLVLEGTGSLVLDRAHRVAFGMESARTTREAFDRWCQRMHYSGVFFHALDFERTPIYHTNVVMSVGSDFSVVCVESISSPAEQDAVVTKLQELGKEVVAISMEQLYSFCGNILQLVSAKGEPKIVLSVPALAAFTAAQRQVLERCGELVAVNIPTLEYVGGGSARCMMAEVFSS